MRPAFNLSEYQAGFEHLRQAMLLGLDQLPAEQHAGSWTIGAYCALVRLVWEQRDPGSDRVKVAAVLGTVLSDVLREAEGAPQGQENPLLVLLEAFHAAAVCCSPRDSQGQPLADGDTILQALGAYAAELLLSVRDPQQRILRTAEFATFVEASVEQLEDARDASPFRPTVIDGGRA